MIKTMIILVLILGLSACMNHRSVTVGLNDYKNIQPEKRKNDDYLIYRPIDRHIFVTHLLAPRETVVVSHKHRQVSDQKPVALYLSSFDANEPADNEKWLMNNTGFTIQVATYYSLSRLNKWLLVHKDSIKQYRVIAWRDAKYGMRYTVFYSKVYHRLRTTKQDLSQVSKQADVIERHLWIRSFSRLQIIRCKMVDQPLFEGETDSDRQRIASWKKEYCHA